MSDQRCLIIGASHGAAQLAPSLRQAGWQGSITIIGDEPHLPYNRPPLSKTFLSGEKGVPDLLIRSESSYQKASIEFLLGRRVISIDRAKKQITLDDGKVLDYDKLALTTGARVRKAQLPGESLRGICYLRNIADVDDIRSYVGAEKQAVIVGGGYIGLETAAMLRKLGMKVTILEMNSRILNRVTAPEVSDFYKRIHQEEGVEIVTGVTVSEFEGHVNVEKVKCSNGRVISADLVVMGIGVLPNIELAAEAGLEVGNGIIVDERCTTNDPHIVAAGDCTQHYHSIYQSNMRLESVQNAVDQAKVAAATICGIDSRYHSIPWFWSDQYDLKLQIAGLSQGYDELIIRGDMAKSRKFSAFYLKNNVIIAVDAINSPQEFMFGKRIIISGTIVDKVRLANPDVPMKEFLV